MLDVGAEHPFWSRIVLSIAVVSPFLQLLFEWLKWRDKGERFASSESISCPPLRLHQYSSFKRRHFKLSKRHEPENQPAGFYFFI
ncbi:hypothetical protein [Paenibacillus amylolyticus]|uniref:hypothetical protein n=1 Tax=Paenibacillus amylolyticus TaxID=1451 RepID=UPI003EB956DF